MIREVPPIGSVLKGAGVYGVPAPSHVTRCPHSNNAFGHNRDCSCGWYRASQAVPYMEDEEELTESPYADPWDEADYLHDLQKERAVFGD